MGAEVRPGDDTEVRVAVRPPVIELTLNRPASLNALTPRMYLELAEWWERYRDDDELRVAIITGAGERAFTAGADLRRTVPLLTGARQPDDEWDERFLADLSIMNAALLRDFRLDKPVIAAVNGDAIGAGTEMLQATDLRIAAATARFGLPEVRQGIIPGGGSVSRLPRQVPWALAAEILLLGQPIDATRALSIGLVNAVVDGAVLDEARRWADRLAECAPLAVKAIKRGMVEGSGRPLDEALRQERGLVAAIMKTDDAREGPRAFLEKRPPVFVGR